MMDYEESDIEYEISMAATLCVQAISAGLSAGFAANMPIGESGEGAFLPPQAGSAAAERVLSALARLRLRRTLTFPAFLDSLGTCTGMDMIVLSCYDHADIQAAISRLRRNGNQVQLVVTKGGAA